jgi:hypothetical protein
LAQGLKAAGYAGYNEGNFLSLIAGLDALVDRHVSIFATSDAQGLMSVIDPRRLKQRLRRVVADSVASMHTGQVWFDKTGNPEMIEAIPALLSIWPGAHVIFAKRRAIENIVSRVIKFPGHDFSYHCADWARNMRAWRCVDQLAVKLKALEIDQYDIARSPQATAGAIGRFLRLPIQNTANMGHIFATSRPQATGQNTSMRILPLSATGWSDKQTALFHQHCDTEMHAFGYTEDESYRCAMVNENSTKRAAA